VAVASAGPYAKKSFAPRSRHVTMPVPHHSAFTDRMPFLPPNQHRQSTEGSGQSTKGSSRSYLKCLSFRWFLPGRKISDRLEKSLNCCWWRCCGLKSPEEKLHN